MRFQITLLLLFCMILGPGLLHFSRINAQTFDLNPPDYYSFEPVFTRAYIVKNKIRTVKAAISYKRDNEPILDKGICKCWEYDENGLLKRYYVTSVRGFISHEVEHPAVYHKGRRIKPSWVSEEPTYLYDTIATTYLYNSNKQISLKRTRDGDYYNAIYYEYDPEGRIKKQSVFRETNASENRNIFRLGVQNMLSSEEFRYEKTSAFQVKRKHLNDEGKTYKESIMNYDSIGRLTEENTSYTVSWMRASTKLKYDKSGRLIQKSTSSNENGEENNHQEFKYVPDTQLLDVEQRYEGDVFVHELNYIYDRQTKMLTSHFTREEREKAIVIVRYTYEYY